jgi:hypothetical protein
MQRKIGPFALSASSHPSPTLSNYRTKPVERSRQRPARGSAIAGARRRYPAILGFAVCLTLAGFALCFSSATSRTAKAQTAPASEAVCCGKKPPKFPDLKATTTTPAQTYSTFSGQVAVVTGQLIGGSSVVVVDLKNENAVTSFNTNWPAPLYRHPAWLTSNIGDVFGLTLDNQGNVYVTATTSYFLKSTVTATPGNQGKIYRIDGATGLVNVFATLPNKGPALGNINYSCQFDSFYVSNFADGRIYQIKKSTSNPSTGVVKSTFDHQTGVIDTSATAGNPEAGTNYGTFSAKNPPGVKRGGRVWGLAVFKNRLYYGVWRQDGGEHAGVDAIANEVWSILLVGGTLNGSPQLEVTLPTLQTTNPGGGMTYSNPVSSISFSPAGDMLLAERSMNGDTNNKGGSFVAHQSRYLEYSRPTGSNPWVLLNPAKFSPGVLSPTGPSSAGGADYDSTATRIWGTADAMSLTAGNYLYGIQGLPMSGGTVSNSILTDLTTSIVNTDKNQMGDVQVPCPDCASTTTATTDCCDKIAAVPYPQNNVQLDYRTFTITNQKGPTSPICSIDISMSPVPNPIWQGGDLYLDGFYQSPGSLFVSPYVRIPNKPSMPATISAVNNVKFNLGVDYTIGWTGTATFVVHHCDGTICTLTYGPWSALPPPTKTNPPIFDITIGQEGKLIMLGLQMKRQESKAPIKWISFQVPGGKGEIFAAATTTPEEARGRTYVPAMVEGDGTSPGALLYSFAQPLKPGEGTSSFNLVLRRDAVASDKPLVIWTTYDENGNALETCTITGTPGK